MGEEGQDRKDKSCTKGKRETIGKGRRERGEKAKRRPSQGMREGD